MMSRVNFHQYMFPLDFSLWTGFILLVSIIMFCSGDLRVLCRVPTVMKVVCHNVSTFYFAKLIS